MELEEIKRKNTIFEPDGSQLNNLSQKLTGNWEDTAYKDCEKDTTMEEDAETLESCKSDDEHMGIGSHGAAERLKLFKQQYHLPYMFIQEPMVNARKIDRFKRILEHQHCAHNISNKIWIFWNNDHQIDILKDKDQHMLLHISKVQPIISFHISVVYAKCDEELRRELWDDLRDIANNVNGPWGVIGDFNVITKAEEKTGGRPYKAEESSDFLSCLTDYNLQDGGYLGSRFTWSDNRDPPNTIWKRLDRLAYNDQWFDVFGGTTVTHLSRTCSDHAPLMINCDTNSSNHIKYFKFLNVWTEHEEYLPIVQKAWDEAKLATPFFCLHQKIKKVCNHLSSWSRATFGDIFEEPKKLEVLIRSLEDNYVNHNTPWIQYKSTHIIIASQELSKDSKIWIDGVYHPLESKDVNPMP
ncbi:hypothetical protein H5410_043305 [Solanum commersonii]|uniref:Endonuclease/exonuclease/phosphatase domain-containing protein n=1 Tax=Solanum commersonii TaxID=4109 RepID=A0A9J5XYT8_SOLCO|nr:hypothetical protein H5410_043305 [Solanum commersonii]